MINKIIQEFNYNNNKIKIETGIIARGSSISLLISLNDTKVIISILELNKRKYNNDFFPLTVNYYERSYAYGKFPNNQLNREIRQNENEILISRLIDRSIRPILSNINNYNKELYITIIALSIEDDVNPDVISIIGVSAALSVLIKDFSPIFCLRLAIDNKKKYIINPYIGIYENSDLSIIISGNNNSITMIELRSNLLSYNIILDAINHCLNNSEIIIYNINEFINKFNKYNNINIIVNDIYRINNNEIIENIINYFIKNEIENTLNIKNKIDRNIEIENVKKRLIYNINNINLSNYNEDEILYNFNLILKKKIRNFIINNRRLDNRKYNEIRNINILFDILPKAHSSCLFTKENTQSLITITLGYNEKNSLIKNKNFMFHYNFLNYFFGEIGFLNFPKRREIGHGKLAYNSILPIIPEYSNFPYTLRIVSDIFESDGSSSMASVCGASLSLMNLGISNQHIAGIAMGLIFTDENNYIILSDISGEEDNYGDMDIKISGNNLGISSLQMDVKICKNININLINNIFNTAKNSLNDILNKMNDKISKPNNFYNKKNIPIFKIIKINKNYIKNIIGRGGNIIKKIISDTGSEININNDGIIKILSDNKKKLDLTIEKINNLLFIPKIGNIYIGKIIKKNNNGLIIYINEINKQFFINYNIKKYNDLNINQDIKVKIININNNNNNKIIFNILKNEKK